MSKLPDVLLPVNQVFCGKEKDVNFINRYIINAVLSYLEHKEQELILGMRYNEWVTIGPGERKELAEHVLDYIKRYAKACNREKDINVDQLRNAIRDNKVIEKAICYLYIYGIYDDCISRYLLLFPKENIPDLVLDGNSMCEQAAKDFDSCVRALSGQESIMVRTRLIEIIKDIYHVKQRFPDTSIYESPLLVDRVFAYVHPRLLPVGKYTSVELFKKIEHSLDEFFKKFYIYLLGSNINYNEFHKMINKYKQILTEFFEKLQEEKELRFYDFQVKGILRALDQLISAFEANKINYLVVEAPTGSGKTEIFILTLLLLSLAKKIILPGDRSIVPVGLLIYPRRALANDQVSRLIHYLYIINQILAKESIDKIKLSIKYTEIRKKEEIEDRLNKENVIERLQYNHRVPIRLNYGVPAYVVRDDDNYYLELPFVRCFDTYPRLEIRMHNGKLQIKVDKVWCYKNNQWHPLDFIYLVRGKNLGDIHITLFETLRGELLKPNNPLFGESRRDRIHPIITVLDEIHTYVDVPGVRYAYLLRRLLNRIRYSKGDFAHLIIGISATIPKRHEFLRRLFLLPETSREDIDRIVVQPSELETVPLGNEYFIITVPTRSAPVDALSVTIQTIMAIYYNMPTLSSGRKKAIVFVEEFNVLRRLLRQLSNKETGVIRREEDDNVKRYGIFGLQDLRNPRHPIYDEKTIPYFNDDPQDLANVKKGRISYVPSLLSWKFGELWWGYMLDTFVYHDKKNNTTKFFNVDEFSSRRQGNLNSDIIVATSSLEVGVDYTDVILIYQHGVPPNIAALVQRAGRAGRRIFENPLTRVAVGVQLSPDRANQAWLFELFTRTKDLRSALDYDNLFLPIESEVLQKQILAELVIEYLVSKSRITPRIARAYIRGAIGASEKFHNELCEAYIDMKDFEKYVSWIFKNVENIEDLIDKIINEIGNDICKSYEN
jgi:superfamily II DNA/RNA helicase